MHSPLHAYKFLLLLVLLISACGREGDGETIPGEDPAPGEPAYYFLQAKEAEGTREKLNLLSAALDAVTDRNDTLLIEVLDYKVYYHSSLKEYDSAYVFADSLINVAQHQQNFRGMGRGYYRRSRINNYLNLQEEVFRDAFESRRYYLEAGNRSAAGKRALEMANAQSSLGDFTGSRESGTEALRDLGENAKDSTYISASHNVIAISYRLQGFYEDAIPEYEQALQYATSREDSLTFINNIALILQELKMYDAAIEMFSANINKVHPENIIQKARYIDNLAHTRWLQDSLAPVEEDLLTAKQMREKVNDREGLQASYDHLFEYYAYRNMPLARQYAERLLEVSRAYNNSRTQLQALKYLLELAPPEQQGTYARQIVNLSDSLNTAALQAKNTFAKIRFDEERKQQEIVKLEARSALQELETQRLRNRGLIILLVVVILVLGLFFLIYYLRQRHKREKVLEVHKTENRISKIIHDELANDIFNVMSSLELQVAAPIVDKLEKIYLRTRDISRENSDIDTGSNYLQNLVATLTNITPYHAKLIIKGENSISWDKLSDEKKIVLYRTLQELLVNMKKHSDARLVAITFAEEGKFLVVNYTDTGTVLTTAHFKKGNGLRNIENRLESINGKVEYNVSESGGFKALVKIP